MPPMYWSIPVPPAWDPVAGIQYFVPSATIACALPGSQ